MYEPEIIFFDKKKTSIIKNGDNTKTGGKKKL